MTPIASLRRLVGTLLQRQQARWSQRPGPILLAGTAVTAVLIGILVASPRTLRSTYSYNVGDYATATVRAPFDLSIPDEAATSRLRDEAARLVIPVAAFDPTPANAVSARMAEVFDQARKRVADADAIRAVPGEELAKLGSTARRRMQETRAHEADEAVKTAVQDLLPSVERQLAIVLTDEERRVLTESRFDGVIEDGLVALVKEAYGRPIARDPRKLREAADLACRPGQAPHVALRTGSASADRVLSDAAMIDDVPGAAARMRARAGRVLPTLPPADRAALVGLASRLIVADTTYDEAATNRRRAQASADVLPVTLQFRRNQLIVDEGREVTHEALLALEYLQQQALPQAFLRRAAGTAIIAWAMLAAMLWLPLRVGLGGVPLRDAVFALFALVGASAACWVWLSLVDSLAAVAPGVSRTALVLLFPVTAVPMLAGLVLSRRAFLGLCAAIAISAGALANLGILFTAHTFAVGLVAGQLVVPCRQRSCIIRAGGASGLVALVTGLSTALLSGTAIGTGELLASAAAACAGAAMGGLVALALSRPVEWLFGYSSNLGLVEWLSYDHPLMRRFMEQAPGTFQHSVSTALLAQAAANAIGADALLVRVGALYHDVGKMEAPQYFMENQRLASPHDRIDPRDSARAILTHVERGVALLARYHVGGRIADFVREHHGTTTVVSFLQKATVAGSQPDIEDYRYPGPRPRSRETAVLMIADRIEAIARARGAASESDFRAIVSRALDELLADGQFDDSTLTLRDLARLQPAFVTALANLYHTRDTYPDVAGPADVLPIPGARNRHAVRLRRAGGERPHRV
jgi:cyclic-di-AMP phosphodiesterase PgpH